MKLHNQSLCIRVRDALFEKILKEYSYMDKLPSEQELANSFGVSRATVREGIKLLETEGCVISRHGVGTFVTCDADAIKGGLLIYNSMTKMISAMGAIPGTSYWRVERQVAPEYIAQKLHIEHQDILCIERVRTMDDMPFMHSAVYLPYDENFQQEYEQYMQEHQSLVDFMVSRNQEVCFASCSIFAILSDTRLEKLLGLSAPSPLLLMRKIHYLANGSIVFYSEGRYLPDKFAFNCTCRYR